MTLGEAARSIDFASRLRLFGGQGHDRLVASGTNTYRGANNREDFETGTF